VRELRLLQTETGDVPFEKWFNGLRDAAMQAIVDARLTRIMDGNFGDHKSVGNGVHELRIHKNPGIRVYYSLDGPWIVILIAGGSKRLNSRTFEPRKRFGRTTAMPSKPYKPMLLARLKDPAYSVAYLTEVLQNESQEAFLIALRLVIEAREEKLGELADKVGVTRQGLAKLLSNAGNPRLSTLNELLKTLGMRIQISSDIAA
jgi:putative addiction module killer protein/probable addiction module antidote protein